MTVERLEAHGGGPVVIDLCGACQSLWFDHLESPRLSPGSTLRLFREIGERLPHGRPPAAVRTAPPCPRCGGRLAPTHDQQRSTRFEYLRCPDGHGRLISFFNFLREKNFIKALSPQQIEELASRLASVHCSNCGAAVDVVAGAACGHCGSPLSLLDMEQAGALVRELQQADRRPEEVPRDLWLRLEKSRQEALVACGDVRSYDHAIDSDLVTSGVVRFARWLTQKA
jgi:hypothetical protein